MYPDQETEMGDDPFTGKELHEIEELLSHISPDLDISFVDVEVDAHEPPVDTTLPNWREKMHNDIVGASEEIEASDKAAIYPLMHFGISEGSGVLKHGSCPWLGMDISGIAQCVFFMKCHFFVAEFKVIVCLEMMNSR